MIRTKSPGWFRLRSRPASHGLSTAEGPLLSHPPACRHERGCGKLNFVQVDLAVHFSPREVDLAVHFPPERWTWRCIFWASDCLQYYTSQ